MSAKTCTCTGRELCGSCPQARWRELWANAPTPADELRAANQRASDAIANLRGAEEVARWWRARAEKAEGALSSIVALGEPPKREPTTIQAATLWKGRAAAMAKLARAALGRDGE